jgi:hypothetical protein
MHLRQRKRKLCKLGERSNWCHFWYSLGRCAFGIDTDLQNNPNNIYFKKVEEIFVRSIRTNSFFRFAQLMPEIASIIGKIFSFNNTARAFINMHLLPLISKKQLHELPGLWLLKRLHPIIEQRQRTPSSRVDVLQLMLQVMTEEAINVS